MAVAAPLLAPVFGPWATAALRASSGRAVPGEALAAGFGELDDRFFYSRVSHDGAEGQWAAGLKAAASYLLEGVADYGGAAKQAGLEGLLDRAGPTSLLPT